MLTSATISGFKCLRHVDVPLHPLTVLIGKNDTGKTSFLEAMHVLSRLVAHREQEALANLGPIGNLIWNGAEGTAQIAWRIALAADPQRGMKSAVSYTLRIAPPADKRSLFTVVKENASGAGAELTTEPGPEEGGRKVNVVDPAGQSLNYVNPGSEAALATIRPEFPTLVGLARSLSSSVLYHLDARQLAKSAPLVDLDGQNAGLKSDGLGLAAVLDALLGEARAAFDEIERELAEAVPFISAIHLRTARVAMVGAQGEPQPSVGKALTFALRSGGEVPASLVSDGVLLFLAYLTLLHSPSAPRVLLLEEPENGIHPRELKRIAEYLRRITAPDRGARQGQVILATHSPYFLDYVDPQSVLVFGRRESGETVVRPMLDLPGVRERIDGGLSLGEMWFNVGEDVLLKDVLT